VAQVGRAPAQQAQDPEFKPQCKKKKKKERKKEKKQNQLYFGGLLLCI
jgi:hypothetical protein